MQRQSHRRRLMTTTSAAAAAALSLSASQILVLTDAFCPGGRVHPLHRQSHHVHSFPQNHDNNHSRRIVSTVVEHRGFAIDDEDDNDTEEAWNDILPYQDTSHNSATIVIPKGPNPAFSRTCFLDRLNDTIEALKQDCKFSLWVEVPMCRAAYMEDLEQLGFSFHHAQDQTAKLNLWLHPQLPSMVPEFATHHVGVGAVVVNSRDEILCVRELRRKNVLPWKIPGGLSELGESIGEAAEREVLEETGIRTSFHSILSYRQAHGMEHGRSDLFFICTLIPEEDEAYDGSSVIPKPRPQESEIEEAKWIPLADYRDMINGVTHETGHPMMRHVLQLYDEGRCIKSHSVKSVIPGRKPSELYLPNAPETEYDGGAMTPLN